MGAASSSQAMAPRNGGVTNEAITSRRTPRCNGMSVRATIQPIGAATAQQIRLTETAMTSVVPSGSTNAGSVNSVAKLASVKLRARSVKPNTTSQPIGSTTSRHSPAANSAITAPDRSMRDRIVAAADLGRASTVKPVSARVGWVSAKRVTQQSLHPGHVGLRPSA